MKKGNAVDNCRSIACLNLIRKLLIGAIAGKTYKNFDEQHMLTKELNECERKAEETSLSSLGIVRQGKQI